MEAKKKICLISDMAGIWFKMNESYFDKIERRIGIKDKDRKKILKILSFLKNRAREGKISTFMLGMLPYKKLKYENFVFLREKFMDLEIKEAKKIYKLNENALKVLKKLHKKVLLIGISDSVLNGDRFKKLLERIGILKFFDFVFTSHDLGLQKPKVFRYFKFLSKNYKVYFLGHEDDEIIGAKKFGFKTIGLRNKNADIFISKLEDLLKIF
ncbi:MAG: HAD family hydrolase [Candidatus Aenigmatarchaeota archaeon]